MYGEHSSTSKWASLSRSPSSSPSSLPSPTSSPGLPQAFFPSLLLSSLELRDTQHYEPQIRALLGSASQFCKVFVLRSETMHPGPSILHPKS